jgi:hypothetical protein
MDSSGRGTHVEINSMPPSTADHYFITDPVDKWVAGPNNLERRLTNVTEQVQNFVLELHEEEETADFLSDEGARRFINFSLLSHLAVQLYDNVPRGTHVKGSISYSHAFTGKDIVVCALST